MSSGRSLRKKGWRLVAITSRQNLGRTLAMLGINAGPAKVFRERKPAPGRYHVFDDGPMCLIYSRIGKQTKAAARKEAAS